jgi:hypothetical protein
LRTILLVLLLAGAGIAGYVALRPSPADSAKTNTASQKVSALVDIVRAASYPQLKDVEIALHPMRSDYIYFESSFTFPSFFLGRKLRYTILFNPEAIARQVPPDGLRAIVAHELAHIDYFNRQSRMGLVSLIQLLWVPFTLRFERAADLEAISLGYGPGLESYRVWLYRNVPPSWMEEKKRDYFSPEEIEAILRSARQNPQIMSVFSVCVPRSLIEVERESRNRSSSCSD